MKPINQILNYLTHKVSIHVPFLIFFGIGFVLAIYVLANGQNNQYGKDINN